MPEHNNNIEQNDFYRMRDEFNKPELTEIVEQATQAIRVLTSGNNAGQPQDGEQLYHKITAVIEGMFEKISNYLQRNIWRSYERTAQQVNYTTTMEEICPWLNSTLAEQKEVLLRKIREHLAQLVLENSAEKSLIPPIMFRDEIDQYLDSYCNTVQYVMDDGKNQAAIQGKHDLFLEEQVQRYEIITNQSDSTCAVCSAMSGQFFDMSEFLIGETAPPFHPNCRCTIREVYALTNATMEENFPIVTNSKGDQAYGGDQSWFSSKNNPATKIQENGGCGPTAAANILVSMALQDSEFAQAFGINTETILTQAEYLKFMQQVYEKVKPMELLGNVTLGIWDIFSFNKKVEAFAKEQGISLSSNTLHNQIIPQGGFGGLPAYQAIDFDEGLRFIKNGIDNQHPIALLNMFSGISMYDESANESSFQQHWVTITGYDEKEEDVILTVSSWGKKFTMSYQQLHQAWQSPFGAMGGMTYFEEE